MAPGVGGSLQAIAKRRVALLTRTQRTAILAARVGYGPAVIDRQRPAKLEAWTAASYSTAARATSGGAVSYGPIARRSGAPAARLGESEGSTLPPADLGRSNESNWGARR